MPDITGGTGTGSVGTPTIDRAISLSGWFGQRRFANLSGVQGTHRVGYLSYLESGAHDWFLVDYADRLYPWAEYCGIPGGIPTDRTQYGPTLTTVNTTAQITAALVACPADQYVRLAAGEYSLGSINWASLVSKTLRGAGPGVTVINFTGSGPGSHAMASNQRIFYEADGVAVSSGYTRGSMEITVADGATFAIGNLIQITQDDSPNTFAPGVGVYHRVGFPGVWGMSTTRNLRFTTRVTNKVGNALTLAAPLHWTYAAGLNPMAYPLRSGPGPSLCGIEEMTINIASGDRAVSFYGADRCWLKNVETYSGGLMLAQVFFEHSSQCEIRRCYVHDGYNYPANGEGYGIMLYYGCSCCLVEDNIGYRTATAILVNGSSGCAVLNNYDEEIRRNNNLFVDQSQMCNHGPQSMHNLWEGNMTARFQSDGYHGSASHQTLLRNHITGYRADVVNPAYSHRPVDLCRGSYYFNLVGNVVGNSLWAPHIRDFDWIESHVWCMYILGPPGMDSTSWATYTSVPFADWTKPVNQPDADVLGTLLRHGDYNYSDSAVLWDGGIASHSIPPSLFYASKPAYFGSLQWPPIGPDVGGLTQNTPAKHRWDDYVVSGILSDLFADEA